MGVQLIRWHSLIKQTHLNIPLCLKPNILNLRIKIMDSFLRLKLNLPNLRNKRTDNFLFWNQIYWI